MPKKSKGKFKPYYRSMVNSDGAEIYRNPSVALDGTDPNTSLKYLKDIFHGKIDEDVIIMVFSECAYDVDQAVETLMKLSNNDDTPCGPSSSAPDDSENSSYVSANCGLEEPPSNQCLESDINDSFSKYIANVGSDESFSASDANESVHATEMESQIGDTYASDAMFQGQNIEYPYSYQPMPQYNNLYDPGANYCSNGTYNFSPSDYSQQFLSTPYYVNYAPHFVTPYSPNPYSASLKSPAKRGNFVKSNPKTAHHVKSPSKISDEKNKKDNIYKSIVAKIKSGVQVLIILRGLPGSGKSTLAKKLKHSGIILSTDDFFVRNNKYIYDCTKLDEAHASTKRRAQKALVDGISPVIIDNTNTEAWEMFPYVALGRKYAYEIFVLEPNTPWKFKPRDLALKNKHGVKKEKIVKMLERYQHNVTIDSIIQHLEGLNKSSKNSAENSNARQTNIAEETKPILPDFVSFKAVVHQEEPTKISDVSANLCSENQFFNYLQNLNESVVDISKNKSVNNMHITCDKNPEVGNGISVKNTKELKSLVGVDSEETQSASSSEESAVYQENQSKNEDISCVSQTEQQLFNSDNLNGSLIDVSKNTLIDGVNIGSVKDVKLGKDDSIKNLEELKSLVEVDSEETQSASSCESGDWVDITERDEDFCWKNLSQNELSLPCVTNYEKGNNSENNDPLLMQELSNSSSERLKNRLTFNKGSPIDNKIPSNLNHCEIKLESELGKEFKNLNLVEKIQIKKSNHVNPDFEKEIGSHNLSDVKISKSISLNNLNKHDICQSTSNVNNVCVDLVKDVDKVSCSLPKSFPYINHPCSPHFHSNESAPLNNQISSERNMQVKKDMLCCNLNLENEDFQNINSPVTSEPSNIVSFPNVDNDTKFLFGESEIPFQKNYIGKIRSESLTSSKSLEICDPKPQRFNRRTNSSKSLDSSDVDKQVPTNFFMLEECQEWDSENCTEVNIDANHFGDLDILHPVPKPQRNIEKKENSTGSEFSSKRFENSSKLDSLNDLFENSNISKASKVRKRPYLFREASLHIDSDWKFPEFTPSIHQNEKIFEDKKVEVCESSSLTEPSDFVIMQKLESGENVSTSYKILTPAFKSVCEQIDNEIKFENNENISQIAKFEKSTSTDDLASEVEKSEKLNRVQECFPDVSEDDLLHLLELCHGNETWLTNLLLDSGYKYNFPNASNDAIKIENTDSSSADLFLNSSHSAISSKLNFQSKEVDSQEHNVESDFVIANQMYENSSPVKQKTPGLPVDNDINSDSSPDELISQFKSDTTSISNLQFSLDPAFAYQLEELFGPVVQRDCNDFLLPCQRIVQIDMKTAELIHKLWKKSANKQENLTDPNGNANKESKKKRNLKVLSTPSPILSERNVNEPLSLSEIMDMEYALELHKKDKLKKDIDFSTKLKRQELYNLYPGADPTALDDIFESNNYSIADSIKALGEELGEQPMVIQESVMVNYKKPPPAPVQKQENVFDDFANSDWRKWVHNKDYDSVNKSVIPPFASTISNEALELRQLATDHFNQRQYFIQKAKDAFHRGMSEVASFYSQKGSDHQHKFKEINKMASKLIAEQRNEALSARVLDLHGLYVQEAIPLLDKFIRNWKQVMQSPQQTYPQTLSVITGQGLHSERGAKLRPSVMEFLRKTGLNFSEVNLGVIDIFLNSD